MTEVISTRSMIRSCALHPDTAMYMVASRTQKLSDAAGAAVGFLDREELDYRAATGIAHSLVGVKIRADKSTSFRPAKSGQLVEIQTRHDPELAGRVLAKSVLSAPIYRDRTIAGCIQLFSRVGELGGRAKHICELMSEVVNLFLSADGSAPMEEHASEQSLFEAQLMDGHAKPANGAVAPPANWQLKWPPEEIRHSRPQMSSFNGSTALVSEEKDRGTIAANQCQIEQLPTMEELLVQLQNDQTPKESLHAGYPPELGHGSADAVVFGPKSRKQSALESEGLRNGAPIRDAVQDASHQVQRHDPGDNGRPALQRISEPHPPPVHGAHSERNSQPHKEGSRRGIRAFLNAIAYPVLVLVFTAFVNVVTGARGWFLELATIIIVAVTTLEIRSRTAKL